MSEQKAVLETGTNDTPIEPDITKGKRLPDTVWVSIEQQVPYVEDSEHLSINDPNDLRPRAVAFIKASVVDHMIEQAIKIETARCLMIGIEQAKELAEALETITTYGSSGTAEFNIAKKALAKYRAARGEQ